MQIAAANPNSVSHALEMLASLAFVCELHYGGSMRPKIRALAFGREADGMPSRLCLCTGRLVRGPPGPSAAFQSCIGTRRHEGGTLARSRNRIYSPPTCGDLELRFGPQSSRNFVTFERGRRQRSLESTSRRSEIDSSRAHSGTESDGRVVLSRRTMSTAPSKVSLQESNSIAASMETRFEICIAPRIVVRLESKARFLRRSSF
jgi:hypothetical protein